MNRSRFFNVENEMEVLGAIFIVKYKSRRRKLYTALNQCIQDIKDTDIENDNLREEIL